MRKEGDKNQNFGKKRDCRSVLTSVQSQRKKKGVGGGGGGGVGGGGICTHLCTISGIYTYSMGIICFRSSSVRTNCSLELNLALHIRNTNRYSSQISMGMPKTMLRVPDQSGVSQAWYIAEIHHSGRKHSMLKKMKIKGQLTKFAKSIFAGRTHTHIQEENHTHLGFVCLLPA